MYESTFGKTFTNEFVEKASINNLDPNDLTAYLNGTGVTLNKGAVQYADAIIKGSEVLSDPDEELLEAFERPKLDFLSEEEYLPAYLELYNALLEQEVE